MKSKTGKPSSKTKPAARDLVEASESLRLLADRDELVPFTVNAFALLALESRFGLSDVVSLAPSILTDGRNDKKCDLLFVGRDHRTAVICQAYMATSAKDTPKVNKASDLNTAVSWILNPTDEDELGTELRAAREELLDAIANDDIDDLELWFCHNLAPSPDVQREVSQAAVVAKSILATHLHRPDINVRGVDVNPVVVDEWLRRNDSRVIIHDKIAVPTDTWIETDGDGWRGVVTTVSGSWLRSMYLKHTPDRLFAGNVRADIKPRKSAGDINNGIQTAARMAPTRFWAFNNGITALVEKIETSTTDRTLAVRGITIINGAQTTGSLGRLLDGDAVGLDKCQVLMRFVEASDLTLINDIRTYNNTQNEILPSDFRSADPVQERLIESFKKSKAATYRGPRRGGAEQGARKPKGLLDADLVAQALAAFHGEPDTAYHAKNQIWRDNVTYARFFSDKTSAAHVVFCVGLVRAVRMYKANLRSSEERTLLQERVFEFLSHRGSDFLLTAAISQCLEEIVGRAITDRWAVSFGAEVSLDVAVEYWAPVVRSLANSEAKLKSAAKSGDLRDRSKVDGAISDFHAAVASNREGNSALDAFSNKVES